MDRQIIPHSPHACCYLCYSTAIDKVCHHCGKAICEKHKSELVFHNPEFTKLFPKERTFHRRKRIIHCRDCVAKIHRRRRHWRYLGWLVPLNWIHARYLGDDRPPVPTVPGISAISIKEKIHGRVTLDAEGCYVEEVTLSPQGTIEVAIKFHEPDQKRIPAYQRKYGITADQDLLFHAGFIVMQQTENVSFESSSVDEFLQPETFILQGKVAEQQFLSQTSGEKQADVWKRTIAYKMVRSDGKVVPLPIQLIPILERDDAVSLIVQARPGIGELVQVKSARIEELKVSASPYLDAVKYTNPPARINIDALEITWHKLALKPHQQPEKTDEIAEKSEQQWQESSEHYMRFKNPIHLGEHHAKLTGKLTMALEGTLSGMETPLLFLPWGEKRNAEEIAEKCKFETEVELGFTLDLSSLRQPKRYPEYAEPNKFAPYQGVILTHQMVTKLTQRLNETGAYVKRVVENPARTDKTNANVTNHFWDLVGRSYEGHYPIDFHLVLTGKQDREQNDASSVSSEIHVHGLVTDEEMQKRVKKVRDELQKVVDDILEQMPSSTPSSVSTDFPSNAKDTQNGSATQLVSQISELLHQLNDVLHHDSR